MDNKGADKKLKICIVALSAYPLLSGRNITRIVGPDVHTVILAKELTKYNFSVIFLTYGENDSSPEIIDNIQVIKTYSLNKKYNIFKKFLYLWKSLSEANADIYYHHGGSSGIVSIFSRFHGKKMIWHIAHDKMVTRDKNNFPLIERILSWIDIYCSDIIITQSKFQSSILEKKFNRSSTVIKNHFEIIKNNNIKKSENPIIIWVGTLAKMKRPDIFIELARNIPNACFQIIGGPSSDPFPYNDTEEQSKTVPNLQFLGFIGNENINEYFEKAWIFVNTADSEGFPYAFIQAWMNKTPVISLNCNPDNIITEYKMGYQSKNFKNLVRDVKLLINNETLRIRMGENGRQYVEKEHDISKIIFQHISLINQLYLRT